MDSQTSIAHDGEEFDFSDEGQDWIASWHPPNIPPPGGKPHGSAAVCLTMDGKIVLVSSNGKSWGPPGGRPESNEDWRMTMEREVLEEACAKVEEASLLGFSKVFVRKVRRKDWYLSGLFGVPLYRYRTGHLSTR